jgi:hypothetical protein
MFHVSSSELTITELDDICRETSCDRLLFIEVGASANNEQCDDLSGMCHGLEKGH